MPTGKPANASLSSISQSRARLAAQMADLDKAEKRLREQERDAGRAVFLAAIKRVRIAEMSREEAKEIATIIGTVPAADIVTALGKLVAAGTVSQEPS